LTEFISKLRILPPQRSSSFSGSSVKYGLYPTFPTLDERIPRTPPSSPNIDLEKGWGLPSRALEGTAIYAMVEGKENKVMRDWILDLTIGNHQKMVAEWEEWVKPYCEQAGIDCSLQFEWMKPTERLLLLASAIAAGELERRRRVTGFSFESLSTEFVYMYHLPEDLIPLITEGLELYYGALL
jgi:hypothetical protein